MVTYVKFQDLLKAIAEQYGAELIAPFYWNQYLVFPNKWRISIYVDRFLSKEGQPTICGEIVEVAVIDAAGLRQDSERVTEQELHDLIRTIKEMK